MITPEMFKQLRDITADAERAARFYEVRPGLTQPATISDLYRSIARLTALVSAALGQVK